MKLDNIIYDINTLGTAIQNDLINESTTFNAMFPSQTATELVNVLAGYGSMLQYNMISALANCYTDTAYSPTGIYQLADTLGNQLHGNISSELLVTITRHDLQEQQVVVIPAGSMFNVEGLDFFNKEDIKFSTSASGNVVNNVTLVQGTKNITEKISTGTAGERFYFSEDFLCNTNMVSVTVNDEDWEITDTFLPLNTATLLDASQAKAFVMRTDAEGRTYLKSGSGANAIIPPAGALIKIHWVSNEGSKGNINKKDPEISLMTPIYYTTSWGKRYQLEVDVALTSTASGGFDKQSLDTLKESSPYVFASGNRAVRRNDYKAILLNKCGYQTCNVWGEYEEAAMQGFYDKIMMNMVYFSGIKTYQKHDLQKIVSLDLDIDNLNFHKVNDPLHPTDSNYAKSWYYEISGNPNNANIRGFLGSYEIELTSTDKNDNNLSLMYVDRYGTGILTLDYSINKDVIDLEFNSQTNPTPYDNYIVDDLGPDIFNNSSNIKLIYDYCDVLDPNVNAPLTITIHNRDSNNDYNDTGTATDYDRYKDLFDSTTYTSSSTLPSKSSAYQVNKSYLCTGSYKGYDTILSPINPVQLLITFPESRRVKNVPVTLSDFPNGIPAGTTIGDYQKEVDSGVISAITFKAPGTDLLLKRFIGSFAIFGTNEDIDYDISTSSIPQPPYYTYRGIINVKNSGTWDRLTDTITINQDLEPEQWTDWFTLNTYNPETNNWTSYKNYLIEIYSFRDNVDEAGLNLAIGEIRASYGNQTVYTRDSSIHADVSNTILPGRSSFIYYGSNNLTTLRLPWKSPTNGNSLRIPDDYRFYSYSVTINDADAAHGYVAGDELTYTYTDNGVSITFTVEIINPSSTPVITYNTIDNDNTILKGALNIEVENQPLTGGMVGSGATITISSDSCVSLYANYIGNWYSDLDIQRVDLPIVEKYNHFTTYLEFKQPKIKNIYIDISVEYENTSNVNDVKNNIINTIDSLFEVKPYSLGKTFNVSDLWKAVSSIDGVGRIIVNTPTTNITALPYELIALPATNLTLRDITTYITGLKIKD